MRILTSAVLGLVASFTLSACVTPDEPQANSGTCPITDAKDLNLWINGMPGPDGPVLIGIFSALAPTPGYSFKGEVTEILESAPPSYVIEVVPTPPDGMVTQVITPTEVRVDVPIDSTEARSVTLTCGDEALFVVDDVTTAW